MDLDAGRYSRRERRFYFFSKPVVKYIPSCTIRLCFQGQTVSNVPRACFSLLESKGAAPRSRRKEGRADAAPPQHARAALHVGSGSEHGVQLWANGERAPRLPWRSAACRCPCPRRRASTEAELELDERRIASDGRSPAALHSVYTQLEKMNPYAAHLYISHPHASVSVSTKK